MLARGKAGKIRPPRRGLATGGAVDFNSVWSNLASAFTQIYTKNASNLSYESLYRDAYKLVLKKEGLTLYEKLKEFEQEWLSQHVAGPIIRHVPAGMYSRESSMGLTVNANERKIAGEQLMRSIRSAWNEFTVSCNMITDVMTYLDRVFCNENKLPGLIPMSQALFKSQILGLQIDDLAQRTTVGDSLVQVILDQIQMERDGDQIQKNLIRGCIHMLEDLSTTPEDEGSTRLYITMFEPKYLQQSRRFFKEESENLLHTVDAASWCRSAKRRLEEESDRCRSTVSALSYSKIMKAIDEEFIVPALPEVINMPSSGVRVMLDNDRIESLREVFTLSSRVDPEKSDLRRAVQARIEELGNVINTMAVTNAQQPPSKPAASEPVEQGTDNKPKTDRPINQQTAAAITWVEEVLSLKLKYDEVLKNAFGDDKTLQSAFTQSFTKFINVSDRSSEYLSLFFDENMKKGIKGKTEAEVDQVLDNGIMLLRYIQDKDLFERYYKRHLSRRLLMKRSVSMDAERQMISKMKMEVGNSFTNRIESMFQDMDLSEELTRKYKHQIAAADPKRTELQTDVLTSSKWPSEIVTAGSEGAHTSCIFPSSIERIKQSFEKFYLDQHTGRKLTWQANMGTADIRAYFRKTKGANKFRELNVSTYAMVILLLFQDLDTDQYLTCEEIQARTNIPMNELARNLQSLAVAPKTRILTKEPMSREIKPNDKFTFNESFHSQFNKVKVGVVSSANKVEAMDERKETEKKNNEDRAVVVDAAIVRIMKQRKSLTHQALMTEVLLQLNARFKPDVSMIKRQIENLIEREYLERAEDVEKPAYNYLA